jgi:hypothetical protein
MKRTIWFVLLLVIVLELCWLFAKKNNEEMILDTPSIPPPTPYLWHQCPKQDGCVTCREGKSAYDWSFIDAIYCICLKDRHDRLENSAAQFHAVGLCNKVIYYRPDKDQSKHVESPGTRGCWESHRAIVMNAKKNQYDEILIFEDDIAFSKHLTPDAVKDVSIMITKLPHNWDVFYLGHFPLFSFPTSKEGIRRTWSATTHAYILNVNNQLSDWLVNTPYDKLQMESETSISGIDTYYYKKGVGYAPDVQLVFQKGLESSIERENMLTKPSEWALKYPSVIAVSLEILSVYVLPLLLVIAILVVFKYAYCPC